MKLFKRFLALLSICYLVSPCGGKAQSLEVSLAWLAEHLDYQYYNEDQGKWWINRFDYSPEKSSVRIQNASANHPRDAGSKQWIHRKLALSQLDPRSVTVDEVLKHRGRIVKGKVLVVYTVGKDRIINKSIDGVVASSESFLQFAIPEKVLENQGYFADSLRYHLQSAIFASASLEVSGWKTSDTKLVFEALKGEFQCPDFERHYLTLYPSTMEFEDYQGESLIRKGFLGYRAGKQQFFEWTVSDSTLAAFDYSVEVGDGIDLIAETDSSRTLQVSSLLFFKLKEDDQEMTCWRTRY